MIDDDIIEEIQFFWEKSEQYNGPRMSFSQTDMRILSDFLGSYFWYNRLRYIYSGVIVHHGRIHGESGFDFSADLDSEEDVFEGVRFFDPIDEIIISEKAFDRLMNRYFKVIIESVPKFKKELLDEDWWPGFVKTAKELDEKVKM